MGVIEQNTLTIRNVIDEINHESKMDLFIKW